MEIACPAGSESAMRLFGDTIRVHEGILDLE